MPRALIAGCGYLGRALADLLAAEHWEIEAWTMSAKSAQELSQRVHRARSVDISNEKDIADYKSAFDAVIHCASTRGGDADSYRRVYLNGVRNLIEHLGDTRFVFTSSTSVYAQKNGEWVSEESAAAPKHERGQILREAEEQVLANGGVVVRLGGIYGPGRSAILRKFLSNEMSIDNDRFVNQIHRDDAATALQLLLNQRLPAGNLLNVVDNEPTLLSECYRWLARTLDLSRLPSVYSTSSQKRGESNKRVSNEKLRALGWAARYPNFAVGMEKSVLPSFTREIG